MLVHAANVSVSALAENNNRRKARVIEEVSILAFISHHMTVGAREENAVIRDPDPLRLASRRDRQARGACAATRCSHEADDPIAAVHGDT